MSMKCPKLVIILSGKRKSGKDFVADILDKRIHSKVIFRISAPIKWQYCKDHGYNYEEALTASSYKEQFRADMLKWSEQVREKDPDIFLRLSIEQSKAHDHAVWILPDARRPTDLKYFTSKDFDQSKIVRIRIRSSEETRKGRGWVFTTGIDDKTTECGLDGHSEWEYIIDNDGTEEELIEKLQPIIDEANKVQQ